MANPWEQAFGDEDVVDATAIVRLASLQLRVPTYDVVVSKVCMF